MALRPSTFESHPEFYPDVVAAGDVATALAQVAADQALDIGAPVSAPDDSSADVRIPSPIPGRAELTITALTFTRAFVIDNNETGTAHAHGRTSDLTEVARAVAAWHAGADPRGIRAAAPFVELPLMAEARATGSAELVVEANWRLRRNALGPRRFKPDDWHEPALLPVLRALFDAAYAEPRLRRLYVVKSHFNLWFSECTEIPLVHVGARIEPRTDGMYGVRPWRDFDEVQWYDTPHAAAARAAEFLPPDCTGAVFGTSADVPTRA